MGIQAAKKASKSAVSGIPTSSKKSTPLLLDKPTLKNIKKHTSFKVITKKDKQNIKKKHLQQKLIANLKTKKELKEAAKRKRKAITGDLKPIQDTLRDILSEDSNTIKEKMENILGNRRNFKPKCRKTCPFFSKF